MSGLGTIVITAVISAVCGGLLGAGAIYKLLIGALENRLRQTFATGTDMNALGSRVNGLETVAVQARDSADEAQGRLVAMEQRNELQWQRLMEVLVRPVERLVNEVQEMGKEVARQGESIRNLRHERQPK